jgi:hypothetical protein
LGPKTASGKIFGARYYAPWLGRWTTADPLGLQAGLNLYLYGRASPAVMVDPNGMLEEEASSVVGQWVEVGKAAYKELQLRSTDKLSEVAPEDVEHWKALRTHSTPDLDAERPVRDPGPDPDTILEEYVGGALAWTLAASFGADMGTGEHAEARQGAWAAYDENPNATVSGEAAALPTRMDPHLEGSLHVATLFGPGILLKYIGRTSQAEAALGASSLRGPGSQRITIFSPPRAGQVQEGVGGEWGPMLEGHGGRVNLGLPPRTVPEGTVIRYPLMEELGEDVAQEVARTGRVPAGTSWGTVGPGDPLPEFVLLPRSGKMVIHPDSTTVRSPTLLRDLVEPNMGLCTFNACTVPLDPSRIRFNPGS